VILAANRITGEEKFDIYGVHTGSSVLVMMDPSTSWVDLEGQSASVIAHEMFHGWLGEAIPQQDPEMLWFTEGATTWYAARMLTAAGVWTPDHSRAVLEARLERDYRLSPLKSQMSISEAAKEVMASPEQVRFAYAGGVNACMNLDQWLAELTGKTRPLDQVLRHLYENRDGSPLTRLAFEKAVLEATGIDCSVWLDDHVYKKTTLPAAIRLI
jgi:predicted metalloprotease with PDZ domain